MQTWDAIRARRNVRSFAERPISDDELHQILDAGRRSPSSNNDQSWDFVVSTDRDQLRRLSKVWQYGAHLAGSAATVALVAQFVDSERLQHSVWYDQGQASMAMMLAAADLGIGSCHSSVGDQDLAREILGVPQGRFVAMLISFGHPADRPLKPIQRPNRRPFEEVVHWGRW
jgi:nitroreductase